MSCILEPKRSSEIVAIAVGVLVGGCVALAHDTGFGPSTSTRAAIRPTAGIRVHGLIMAMFDDIILRAMTHYHDIQAGRWSSSPHSEPQLIGNASASVAGSSMSMLHATVTVS